jgi:hypothetical protein
MKRVAQHRGVRNSTGMKVKKAATVRLVRESTSKDTSVLFEKIPLTEQEVQYFSFLNVVFKCRVTFPSLLSMLWLTVHLIIPS